MSSKPTSKSAMSARIAAAKEKGKENRRLQEEALARLPPNTLYIKLYIRSDPPTPSNFHWAMYLHTGTLGGTKYHVSNLSGGWIADHGSNSGAFNSNFLCVMVQIATIPKSRHGEVDQIMRSFDSSVNGIPGITCRVWVIKVLEILVQRGLVRCSSLAALEKECMEIGNENSLSASMNVQPRPVAVSTACL